MNKLDRRFWVCAGLALVGAMVTSYIECPTNDVVCRVMDGFFLFMTVIFGAGFGIALSQRWAENDKNRDKS